MLRQSPPPALVDGKAVHLASDGQRLCVRLRDRFTVFGDTARGRQLDAGTVPTLANLQFTWAGDRLYAIETDAAGGTSRVHHTRVGSGGAWESLTYDPASMPVDAEPGQTWVEAYDMVDGEAVLLVRKSYARGAGAAGSRGPTYAILRGPRLVASWSGDPPGRIRPALRSIVGWHRSLGSLRAVLTLRSLDDGSVRRIAVDAGGALRAIAPPTGR
jgi:hypothetical protein